MKKAQTLVEKARTVISVRAQSEPVDPDEVALIIEWARGSISSVQAAGALGKTGGWPSWLAPRVRRAVRSGQLVIRQSDE